MAYSVNSGTLVYSFFAGSDFFTGSVFGAGSVFLAGSAFLTGSDFLTGAGVGSTTVGVCGPSTSSGTTGTTDGSGSTGCSGVCGPSTPSTGSGTTGTTDFSEFSGLFAVSKTIWTTLYSLCFGANFIKKLAIIKRIHSTPVIIRLKIRLVL